MLALPETPDDRRVEAQRSTPFDKCSESLKNLAQHLPERNRSFARHPACGKAPQRFLRGLLLFYFAWSVEA